MRSIGRYEIRDILGAGSMGTVYRAWDSMLEREVALKTIRNEAGSEPELRERFFREARLYARLQHPSIVVVYDLCEVDAVACITMELLHGSDFRKLIHERSPMPLAAKLEAMCQIAEGLGYAHKLGIIHRDIKPSNLFLTDDKRAKLLDFGIAHLPSSKLTVEGRVLGTPNYMAPEQILDQPSGTCADLFSAAVVFFELLVYVHPFHGDVVPTRIAQDTPDSLFAYDSKLPLVLERIFSRALAKDPAQRYQTGEELAADFRCVVDAMSAHGATGLSDIQLPSERAEALQLLASKPDVASVTTVAQPEDHAEAYQARLEALMQLVAQFDWALAAGDVERARQTFLEMEKLEAVDPRLADVTRPIRVRLNAIREAQTPATAIAGPAVTASSLSAAAGVKKTCRHCGTSNRGVAVYCIQCGARLAVETEPPPAVSSLTAQINSLPPEKPAAPPPLISGRTIPITEAPSQGRTGVPGWLSKLLPPRRQ